MRNINILIGIIVFLFVILLTGLLLIQKPDCVIGKFNIYSSCIPRSLKTKVDGEVIFLKDSKSEVRKGDDLAFIKTSSDYYQIVELEKIIEEKDIFTVKHLLENKRFSMLGELSSPFYELVHSFETFDNQMNDDMHRLDQKQTEIEINSYQMSYSAKVNNINLQKEQLQIAKQNYEADSALYEMNAITRATFYNSRTNYLAKEEQYKKSIEQLEQLSNNIQSAYTNNAKVKAQQNKQLTVDRTTIEYKLQILKASIKEWRNKYVLSAPCQGQIEFPVFIENGQMVKYGEEIIRVIPQGNDIKAIVYYPTLNSAGIHIGSPVKLYFDNYEKNTYGYYTSKISSISKVVTTNTDGQTFYTGELHIDLSSQENFDGKIDIDEGMSGEAQIIIKDKNLFKKIFNWINILTSK